VTISASRSPLSEKRPGAGFVRQIRSGGVVVAPARRGTFIVPAKVEWIIKRGAADLTSRSLRETDPTSGSLRSTDATSASLRSAEPTGRSLQGAVVYVQLGSTALRARYLSRIGRRSQFPNKALIHQEAVFIGVGSQRRISSCPCRDSAFQRSPKGACVMSRLRMLAIGSATTKPTT
jgi:hypothetical protein